MLVNFITKGARIYNSEVEAMEKKLVRRLEKYFNDDNTECFVKFSEKKLEFKTEITLTYLGCQLRSETKDRENFAASLDKCLDVMERQITKCKGKLGARRQQNDIIDIPDFVPEPEEYNVVRTKEYEMKPMSVQDAILQMNLSDHVFYTFNSSDLNKICTVYKRDDGDYGLIIPK